MKHPTKKPKSNHNSWFWKPILALSFITLGVSVWYARPRPKPLSINKVEYSSSSVAVALYPEMLNLTPNIEETLDLTINAGTNRVTAAAVELAYDPSLLGIPTITQGDFLSNTLVAPVVKKGKITFTFAAAPESGGQSGSGTLATLHISPTSVGETNISFTNNSAVSAIDSDGQVLNSNVLKSATPAQITIMSIDSDSPPTLDYPYTQEELDKKFDPSQNLNFFQRFLAWFLNIFAFN